MRNSMGGFLLKLILLVGLAVLVLLVVQNAWLVVIGSLLKNDQSAGLPVSTTPISAFAIPTAGPAAPIGTEQVDGNLAITVTRVVYPADATVAKTYYKTLEPGQAFILVGIQARCISTATSPCNATEFDFGVSGSSGQDYMAEMDLNFDGLNGLFQGGEIAPGKQQTGDLVFIIANSDTGLLLEYPRLFAFGQAIRFRLGP